MMLMIMLTMIMIICGLPVRGARDMNSCGHNNAVGGGAKTLGVFAQT